MGYDLERFVSRPPDALICVVCKQVVENPVGCPEEHLFCSQRIKKEIRSSSPKCPVDRQVLTSSNLKPASSAIMRIIMGLEIKCVNHKDGCDFVSTIDGHSSHASMCIVWPSSDQEEQVARIRDRVRANQLQLSTPLDPNVSGNATLDQTTGHNTISDQDILDQIAGLQKLLTTRSGQDEVTSATSSQSGQQPQNAPVISQPTSNQQSYDEQLADIGQRMRASSAKPIRTARSASGPIASGFRQATPTREINILILAETGVGKSTFINAFANYVTYQTLVEALMANKLNYVVPSSFIVTTVDGNGSFVQKKIIVGGHDANEDTSNGASATQAATPYAFLLGDIVVRFIDTGGICDTRGESE